jgi:hypothetical protein
MRELPAGTVTMLFSDIEGSTALLGRLGYRYGDALAAQRAIMRAAISAGGGHEMGTEGDSFYVVFGSAADAVTCCLAAQRALASHPWSGGVAVRVRMGLHSGEPVRHQDGYVGMDVHRAGDHGPQDHGFVAGREALVVADGAAVLADPGECPLYDPPARQHLERVPVGPGDDLQGHLHGRGPGGELAGVDGVGPDQADAAAGAVQVPQQRPGRVAVLDGRGGDHHGEQQAHRVHGDVPFPAVIWSPYFGVFAVAAAGVLCAFSAW